MPDYLQRTLSPFGTTHYYKLLDSIYKYLYPIDFNEMIELDRINCALRQDVLIQEDLGCPAEIIKTPDSLVADGVIPVPLVAEPDRAYSPRNTLISSTPSLPDLDGGTTSPTELLTNDLRDILAKLIVKKLISIEAIREFILYRKSQNHDSSPARVIYLRSIIDNILNSPITFWYCGKLCKGGDPYLINYHDYEAKYLLFSSPVIYQLYHDRKLSVDEIIYLGKKYDFNAKQLDIFEEIIIKFYRYNFNLDSIEQICNLIGEHGNVPDGYYIRETERGARIEQHEVDPIGETLGQPVLFSAPTFWGASDTVIAAGSLSDAPKDLQDTKYDGSGQQDSFGFHGYGCCGSSTCTVCHPVPSTPPVSPSLSSALSQQVSSPPITPLTAPTTPTTPSSTNSRRL